MVSRLAPKRRHQPRRLRPRPARVHGLSPARGIPAFRRQHLRHLPLPGQLDHLRLRPLGNQPPAPPPAAPPADLMSAFRDGPLRGVERRRFCGPQNHLRTLVRQLQLLRLRRGQVLLRQRQQTLPRRRAPLPAQPPFRRAHRAPGRPPRRRARPGRLLRRPHHSVLLPQGAARNTTSSTRSTPPAAPRASSPTAIATTWSPATCPTGALSLSPAAATAGSTAGSPRSPPFTVATPTAPTSAPSPATTSRTTPPGPCPTAASFTPAGNTSTAARSTTIISGS